MISIASLSDFDDFRLIESDYALIGRRSGRSFRMGDKVWIKVIAANLDKRQLDYEWVLQPGHHKKEKEQKQPEKIKAQKVKAREPKRLIE